MMREPCWPGVVGRAVLQLSPTAGQQPNEYHQESNLMRVSGHGSCPHYSQSISSWLRANDLTEVCLPPDWSQWERDVDLGELSCFKWKAPFETSGSFRISAEWGPLLHAWVLQKCCCFLKLWQISFCSIQPIAILLQLSITESDQSYSVLADS